MKRTLGLALVVVVVGLVVLSYWVFNRPVVEVINKAGIPIVPRIDPAEVTQVTSDSLRGTLQSWNRESLTTIMSIPGKGRQSVTWQIVSDTDFECIDDVYKNPDGTVLRRSNIQLVFKDKPTRQMGRGYSWFDEGAKNGSVVLVFGRDGSNVAEVVYLFKDSCK